MVAYNTVAGQQNTVVGHILHSARTLMKLGAWNTCRGLLPVDSGGWRPVLNMSSHVTPAAAQVKLSGMFYGRHHTTPASIHVFIVLSSFIIFLSFFPSVSFALKSFRRQS